MQATFAFIIAIVLFVIAAILVLATRQRHNKVKRGKILPADEMKQKYGLTAKNYNIHHLDPRKVPKQFRHLTPLAQKWGIGDDIIRTDFHGKASGEEKQVLQLSLDGRTQAISQWLDTCVKGPMTEESAAYMYMLIGLEEMGIQVEPGPDFRS